MKYIIKDGVTVAADHGDYILMFSQPSGSFEEAGAASQLAKDLAKETGKPVLSSAQQKAPQQMSQATGPWCPACKARLLGGENEAGRICLTCFAECEVYDGQDLMKG